MGSSASKPARSAAQAATRRQYPKQPSAPSPSPAAAKPNRPPPPPSSSPASRESNVPPQTPAQGPTYHSKEKASVDKSSAIDLDGRDPHFAASLRSIGAVTPNPTFSPSSTFNQSQTVTQQPSNASQNAPQSQPHPQIFPSQSANPALLVVNARARITREAESETEDFGKGAFRGRRYFDAFTIRQALAMREKQGLKESEIERTLRLREGVLGGLASPKGTGKGIFGVP